MPAIDGYMGCPNEECDGTEILAMVPAWFDITDERAKPNEFDTSCTVFHCATCKWVLEPGTDVPDEPQRRLGDFIDALDTIVGIT